MKTILFTLSILFFTSSLAQELKDKTQPPKQSKWLIGFTYSPELAYRILTHSKESNPLTASVINFRKDSEQAKFGYSAKIFCGYRLSNKLILEGGFGYTDFGDRLKPYSATFGQNSNEYATSSGHIHIPFFSIPISLHMNLGGNRIQGFISGGVAPSYLFWYRTNYKIEYPDGTETSGYHVGATDNSNISKFILEAHISGGIAVKINNKLCLRIAPEFKISATDTYSDYPIRANYFNAGIEIGMVYKL